MLHFRELDVYRCAIAVLPKAYAIATELDGEMAGQLRRAALSISLNIGRGNWTIRSRPRVTARGSTLECGAILDAMRALGLARRGRGKRPAPRTDRVDVDQDDRLVAYACAYALRIRQLNTCELWV